MLNLGVDLKYNQVTITALSEGFAFLDELLLCMNDYSQFDIWLESLLLKDDEPVAWFFCEKSFYEWNGPVFFSKDQKDSHGYFLVKDRIIVNLYKVCCNLLFNNKYYYDFKISYLLAIARSVVDDAYICQYNGPIK